MSDNEIAEYAFSEVNDMREAQGGSPMPYTQFKRAQKYSTQSFNILSSSGYHPDSRFPDLADQARIEYVKAKLMGVPPENHTGFVTMRTRWAQHAAAEKHYTEGVEAREAEEQAKKDLISQRGDRLV